MQRGFKAQAERLAERLREEVGIGPYGSLDPVRLARHVGADVRSAAELTNVNKLQALEHLQPQAFSACTFQIGAKRVIVFNPLASLARRQSDLAHELAHILLNHDVGSVQTVGAVAFFTCNDEQEQEATWLAGCLLLPRPLLVRATRNGMAPADIVRKFAVSESMVRFRLGATGVRKQLSS